LVGFLLLELLPVLFFEADAVVIGVVFVVGNCFLGILSCVLTLVVCFDFLCVPKTLLSTGLVRIFFLSLEGRITFTFTSGFDDFSCFFC